MGSIGARPGAGAAVPGRGIELLEAMGEETFLIVFIGGSEYAESLEYPL